MRIKKLIIPGLFAVSLFALEACKKDSDIPEFARCVAGRDGNITIELTAMHHSKIIPSQPAYPDTAYIKFNTSEFPGENPEVYDLVVAGVYPDTTIIITNMSCGNYYIFMTGFDTGIAQRVKGGIPVTIHEEEDHQDLNIPVTEY